MGCTVRVQMSVDRDVYSAVNIFFTHPGHDLQCFIWSDHACEKVENGGKLTVQAEAKPDSEYLINYAMSGTLGSYTCYVAGDLPSDRIAGLGLGFAKGGKDHTSFLLTFQETVAP